MAAKQALKRTALHSWHVQNGGKMVEFAGYDMPVLYKDHGVMAEHKACRSQSALFDVSHMGQLFLSGGDAGRLLKLATPSFLGKEGVAKLSVLLNSNGGIEDDTVFTRRGEGFYQVVNAACVDKDLANLRRLIGEHRLDVEIDHREDLGLLALQGPKSMEILASLSDGATDLTKMPFMTGLPLKIDDFEAYVTRCGYTGEDGFEISVEGDKSERLAEMLTEKGTVPAGLGARDSLRMEAGLCLYGNEMDASTGPVEAGLLFVVPKSRRQEGGFIGAESVQRMIVEGPKEQRVGLLIEGKAPVRAGATLHSPEDGSQVGRVTSGGPSPTLGQNIAMGYLPPALSTPGTAVQVSLRGSMKPATVTGLPFVPSKYYRVKK